jgi:cobalamin transport system ATP-binding protein
LLSAADVSFAYSRPRRDVLQGVSLEVRRGEILGIIGPNGSGKTTLLKLLNRTLPPGSGQVTLDGTPLDSLSRREVARRIAVVPQTTQVVFEYTVQEIVLMGRHPHLRTFELEGPSDLAVAREALRATGALDLEHRPFTTLSGGERQRVIIAGALAQSTEMLLLDEPTAALDLGSQLEMVRLLATLNRDHRITIVLSTHDLNFAASLCGELVMLREGRVIAAGATETVLTPEHVRALYDVEADVGWHPGARHRVVVPMRKVRRTDSVSASRDS